MTSVSANGSGGLDGSLFLVWGPPGHGPRSRVFARELAIDVEFVCSTRRRGLLVAPLKYTRQAVETIQLLLRRRPSLVFVQSPPSLAVLLVAIYGAVTGARYVVDAHSDAMMSPIWTRPRQLQRLLARRAAATIVTSEHFADTIRDWGGRALVLRDIPTSFPLGRLTALPGDFNVLVVNTFAPDEPLDEILEAAASLGDVTFHVTGDTGRAPRHLLDRAPPNVRFTGYLPDDEYYALIGASQAVMCLTTRDHTMQRGACEALSMGKPIITSDWPLLRSYFAEGTAHVDNTSAGIRAGVAAVRDNRRAYEEGIADLQEIQRREWEAARGSLGELIGGAAMASADTGSR